MKEIMNACLTSIRQMGSGQPAFPFKVAAVIPSQGQSLIYRQPTFLSHKKLIEL